MKTALRQGSIDGSRAAGSGHSAPHISLARGEGPRTRLHSVLSVFQLATVAVVLRNILKPCLATFSATSRKSEQRCVLDLARNSSTRRCPMLKPLQQRSEWEGRASGRQRRPQHSIRTGSGNHASQVAMHRGSEHAMRGRAGKGSAGQGATEATGGRQRRRRLTSCLAACSLPPHPRNLLLVVAPCCRR